MVRRPGRPPRRRHHQPARDRHALGPRDARARPAARSCGRTGVRRTSAPGCATTGHEPRVAELTGLRLDPYFSGTKLAWIAEHEPNTWALVESGRYAVGTIDSYLVARMTRGTWHITDVSNASRTLLFDLEAGDWSDELCGLFGVPRDALPEVVPSWGELATTDPRPFLGLELPIAGIAGDQQSALFGQTCFEVGETKCTYGTGSFILTNTGTEVVRSDAGLLSTAAWRSPEGELTYAVEGAIFVTGAAVQWLRDGLQIVGSAAETAGHRRRPSTSTEGVVFVPALTGLGAPDWDPHARGLIIGITRGTTRAHIVRATLEAIAFEVRDVVDTMPALDLARGRRRRQRQRPALPAAGRPARRPRRAAEDRRDHRARRRVPRRPRHRRLGVHRRAPRHLGARPALRAPRATGPPPTPPTPGGATRSSAARAGRRRPLSRGALAPPRGLGCHQMSSSRAMRR